MSYSTIDNSVESGKPVMLLEFTRHATVTRFNSGAIDLISGPLNYRAVAFELSARTQGKDIFKDPLRISFPRTNLFARSYVLAYHQQPTTVTLKRHHIGLDLGTAVVEWKGRIVTANPQGDKIVLECESVYTSMRRLGLAAQIELTCIHAIYSAGCKANKPAARFDGDVLSVSGHVYSVDGAAGFPNGYFNAGMMEGNDERRFILNHVGENITLSRPLGVIAGQSVALYPGCDKRLETCRDKFSNLDNYLGFPWMPDQNPFGGMPIARL